MPDHNAIYRQENARYEALISREDYEGNLLKSLAQLVPLPGSFVIDSGSGTGRLARLLTPVAKKIYAFDLSAHMLRVALDELRQSRQSNWTVAAADHRYLPVRDHLADVLVSGWSVTMLFVNYPESWQVQVERALQEFQRVVRPGGKVVIIETLGTGYEKPFRIPKLEPFFQFLEYHGYEPTAIRTDYQFENLEEARDLSQFFFGEELARQVIQNNWIVLPECTGLWSKQF